MSGLRLTDVSKRKERDDYAIQVKFDGHWIFLATDDDDGNIMVRTFDTREEAEALLERWDAENQPLRVVEYLTATS